MSGTSTPRTSAVRDAARPRIHTFVSTSDIHIEHQLRLDARGRQGPARAAVAHARELVRRRRVLARWTPRAPTSSSPPRSSRSRSTRARRRSTSPTPSATRCRTSTPPSSARLYELRPGPARRRALRPLPRRPRPRRRQLVRRRAGRRPPGRVRGQRHRRARGQRLARGDRDAAAHARAPTSASHRRQHARDRAHQPPRLAPDRLRRAAEQGDRRPQRVRPRVRHPPGRRAQGALDLRDHGRDDGRARGELDRARQALRAPRAQAARWRSSGSRSRARRSTRRSSASRTSRTRRSRSPRSTSRRW